MIHLKRALFVGLSLIGLASTAGAQNFAPEPFPFAGQQNQPQVQVRQADPGTPEYVRIEEEKRQAEAGKRDWIAKVFEIKYADSNQVSALKAALGIFSADIGYAGGRFLTVRAPKEIMPAIEDAIKRLDVPTVSKTAELTAFVLLASNDAAAAVPLVASLQSVANQLKSVLAYKNFLLLDTLIARGTDGRMFDLRGVIMIPGASVSTSYTMHGNFRVNAADDKSPVLQISNLELSLQVPEQTGGMQQFRELKVSTNVDVPSGKQIVVGKTTFNDKAFILVLSAKFD